MSRNNKNARQKVAARERSKNRLAGNKGAAKTTPKHGKTKAWWQKFRTYHEFFLSMTGKSRKPARQDATVAE